MAIMRRKHSYLNVVVLLLIILQMTHSFIQPRSNAFVRTGTRCNVFNFFKEGKKALVKSLAGNYDAKEIRSRIETLIEENAVLMLSFTSCPYCIKAKACLDAKKTKYRVVELDVDAQGKAMRAELGELVGRTSVPAIWIGKKFVGGCNDGPMGGVLQLDQRGELDRMLKAVKAI
jgi:glutaredoxin 3